MTKFSNKYGSTEHLTQTLGGRLASFSYEPINQDGLPLVASVSHLHPGHHQPVHLGTDAVQVDLHVEGSARLDIELVIHESAVLSDSDIENRDRSHASDLTGDLQVRPREVRVSRLLIDRMVSVATQYLLLLEIDEIRLALDKRDLRHFRVVRGVPAWSETHVALHHDGLLGSLGILHHHVMIEDGPTLEKQSESL